MTTLESKALSGSMSFSRTVLQLNGRIVQSSGTLWRKWRKRKKKSTGFSRKLAIAMVFILLCTFGSSFGLLNIIKYGYGTFTTIVGPVMLVPLIISVPYRLYKDRKDGILTENYELKEAK